MLVVLSRQTRVCRNKSFVSTNTCLSQQRFCLDEHTFVEKKKNVFCRDKHVFIATKVYKVMFVAANICRDKSFVATYFFRDKTFVTTSILLSRQNDTGGSSRQ